MDGTAVVVDCARRLLTASGAAWPCAIGRGGAVPEADKREGDGATPLGQWPVRGALLRPGCGIGPPTALPWRWLRPWDGWSDAPADPAYNRPVQHPHPGSAEQLWRTDTVYDVIIVLGHNDSPPAPGRGSAIFWHLARPDFQPTEGCVAIARAAMAEILPHLHPGMTLAIDPGAPRAPS